jgi:hypothetical protein
MSGKRVNQACVFMIEDGFPTTPFRDTFRMADHTPGMCRARRVTRYLSSDGLT